MTATITIFCFSLCCFVISAQIHYDKVQNKKMYKGYGEDWIFFPDGNGNITVGLLRAPIPFVGKWGLFYDLENSVTFKLYTRDNPTKGDNLDFKKSSLQSLKYNPKKQTKFITHGWLSSGDSDTCQTIKDAYLENYDHNIIIVDWSPIAGNILYPIPMSYTNNVGKLFAEKIDSLIDFGANPQNIHLIGHSLGAHVSGFVGQYVKKGKIGRITGLDPAYPGFTYGSMTGGRLSKKSANFVDVIHSCAGALGLETPIGHADFYPNGGFPPQPGCEGFQEVIEACSHGRSWELFRESINSNNQFVAYNCQSWFNFQNGQCKSGQILMGDPTTPNSAGTYFLITSNQRPFTYNSLGSK